MNGTALRCNHKQLELTTTGGVLELDNIGYTFEMFDKKTPSET